MTTTMITASQTVLILGANGRFGRHCALAFKQAGWQVRTFDRSTDNLKNAAQGVDVIVAGWNLKYHEWAAQLPPMHARIRKAALDNDATVILPGNVYVFGPQAPTPWAEDTPHLATNPLGRIRMDMEAAYAREGVKTILLRAGDFLDDQASGNWFDKIIAKPLSKGHIDYPGDANAPHSWAYLPDMARAAVLLAEMRAQLQRFEDVPFPGYTLSGVQLAACLERVSGTPVSCRNWAWWPLHLARPFMAEAKHLLEMRYLWSLPHSQSDQKFRRLLPTFEATPPEQALRTASASLRKG